MRVSGKAGGSSSSARSLVRLSYVLGVLLVVLPLLDLAANAWPWTPGEMNWRYGAYTLLSGFLLTPTVGLALLAGAAVAAGSRGVGRSVAGFALALVVVLLAATAVFGLDAVQLSATVPDPAATQFRIGVAKAVVKNLAMVGGLLVIGHIGWHGTRRAATVKGSATTPAHPPLVGSREA